MKNNYALSVLLITIGLNGCTHLDEKIKSAAKCDEDTKIFVGDKVTQVIRINCDTESLAENIQKAQSGDLILVKGTCKENRTVEINRDGITLQGMGVKIVGRPNTNAIAVNAKGVTISHLDISGSLNGIVTSRSARTDIRHVSLHDNKGFGMVVGDSTIVTSKDLEKLLAIIKRISNTSETNPDNTADSPNNLGVTPSALLATPEEQTQHSSSGLVTVCGVKLNQNEIGGVFITNGLGYDIACQNNQINDNGWLGMLSQREGSISVLADADAQVTGNGHLQPAYGWGAALQSSSNLTTFKNSNSNFRNNVKNQNISVDSSSCVESKGVFFINPQILPTQGPC